MIKNRKGVIALAVVISMLLVISAMAVFGMVSGRFSITAKANKKVQDLRDAESASYVTYQLIMGNVPTSNPQWAIPASGVTTSRTVTLSRPSTGAAQAIVDVDVDIDGTAVSGCNPIRARVQR